MLRALNELKAFGLYKVGRVVHSGIGCAVIDLVYNMYISPFQKKLEAVVGKLVVYMYMCY